MAPHTDTEIYKATYALCQLVTQLVAGMPRNYKADFGADLRKGCMTLVRRTYQANVREDKAPVLQRAGHDLRWPLLTKTARSAIPSSACSYQLNSFLNHSNRRFFP